MQGLLSHTQPQIRGFCMGSGRIVISATGHLPAVFLQR